MGLRVLFGLAGALLLVYGGVSLWQSLRSEEPLTLQTLVAVVICLGGAIFLVSACLPDQRKGAGAA